MAIQSGIYMILNRLNGKRYVGSAVNLKKRRVDHFRALRKGMHHNTYFQRAFKKCGEDVFGWEVLEYIWDLEMLISRENLYLGMFPSWLLYNECPVAGSSLGYKHTEEWCRNHSKIMSELWSNEEFRQIQLNARKTGEQSPFYGTHKSTEEKQKQSEAMLELWADPEYRQKQLEIQNSDKTRQRHREAALALWTDEEWRQKQIEILNSAGTKQKKSEASLRHWADPKQRQKHSATMSKHWADEEYRQMMYDANPALQPGTQNPNYGKSFSDERKHNISLGLRRSRARRKRTEYLLMVAQLIGILQKRLDGLAVTA